VKNQVKELNVSELGSWGTFHKDKELLRKHSSLNKTVVKLKDRFSKRKYSSPYYRGQRTTDVSWW